ncbi:hypothetical protein ACELLULO517_23700 [Acidisoma cellulosilytica]|uniref:Uncharacterized protein n=1 Tax=Acidisoma cellulosilyticum TaxID=2802395 RepID=A0A964E666_9PROT|nr:hypothetical protein [Acidisoma cellulosilyticum]MCB8883274.1 hypothetical protein [Acidisoma cellulosilyticum]
MPDEPDNILLAYMRRFDEKLDRVIQTQGDHSARLSQLDLGQAGMRRDFAVQAESIALLGMRLDRLGERLERIERRLGLIEA